MCHCEEGWKGPECDVPAGECQVPGCNGHGRCIEGDCHCERGWKGQFCELRKYYYSQYTHPKLVSWTRVVVQGSAGGLGFFEKATKRVTIRSNLNF